MLFTVSLSLSCSLALTVIVSYLICWDLLRAAVVVDYFICNKEENMSNTTSTSYQWKPLISATQSFWIKILWYTHAIHNYDISISYMRKQAQINQTIQPVMQKVLERQMHLIEIHKLHWIKTFAKLINVPNVHGSLIVQYRVNASIRSVHWVLIRSEEDFKYFDGKFCYHCSYTVTIF